MTKLSKTTSREQFLKGVKREKRRQIKNLEDQVEQDMTDAQERGLKVVTVDLDGEPGKIVRAVIKHYTSPEMGWTVKRKTVKNTPKLIFS